MGITYVRCPETHSSIENETMGYDQIRLLLPWAKQLLALALDGYSNKVIANRLDMTPTQVRKLRELLCRELQRSGHILVSDLAPLVDSVQNSRYDKTEQQLQPMVRVEDNSQQPPFNAVNGEWMVSEPLDERVIRAFDAVIFELRQNNRLHHPTKFESILRMILDAAGKAVTLESIADSLYSGADNPLEQARVALCKLNVKLSDHSVRIGPTPTPTPMRAFVTDSSQ